jgi:putative transposase
MAEQIIGILHEADAGTSTAEVYRRHGISPATFYNWKARFGGMGVSDARRPPPRPGAVGLQRTSCLQADQHAPVCGPLSADRRRHPGLAPTALVIGGGAASLRLSTVGVLLRREGFPVNHKRVYRLYREEGLSVRRRKRKRWRSPHGSMRQRPRPRTSVGRWTSFRTRSPTAGGPGC